MTMLLPRWQFLTVKLMILTIHYEFDKSILYKVYFRMGIDLQMNPKAPIWGKEEKAWKIKYFIDRVFYGPANTFQRLYCRQFVRLGEKRH